MNINIFCCMWSLRLNIAVCELPGDEVEGGGGHLALRDVEGDQLPTAARHGEHARVADQLTPAHGELAEAGQRARHLPQPLVRHVALAEVQAAEARAADGEREERGVGDGRACAGVEVAELVAVGDEVPQPGVRHAPAVRHREVPEEHQYLKVNLILILEKLICLTLARDRAWPAHTGRCPRGWGTGTGRAPAAAGSSARYCAPRHLR